jgi:hypothetical protein
MLDRAHRIQEAELKRLARVKSGPPKSTELLGPQMIEFFKRSVQKRQGKMTRIAEAWLALVPPMLNDHCAIESFTRGSLTVLVDTSSHLYEIKQLLLAGLQRQLLLACKSTGLRKIMLKPGRWYDGTPTEPKLRFDP